MRVEATKFDNDKRDNAGMTFSERWLADGNGTWCYGTISRVYVKRRGAAQKYSVKYDIGGTMACEEQHIENAGIEESDSEDESKNDEGEDSDMDNADNDEDNETDEEEDEGGIVMEEDQDNIQTDESEGGRAEDNQRDYRDAEITEIGETVWCGKEDDPLRQCWRRVEAITEDVRRGETEETRFKNLRITDTTTELEIFWALMPLKQEDLLKIIREGADKANSRVAWEVEHVNAALCVIFGGAQFKDMTDLWSIKRKGMMPAPDFGLYLSRDRFKKILRYWARGPEGTSEKLRNNPWEEVDYWVRAFNKIRREEIEVGTNVTPDEMMFAWRGKKGNGGIPHLSLLIRKPIPLGTESKVACEGTFGMCMYLEIQKGKVAMARKKFCRQYKATTACTVRLLSKMGLNETDLPLNSKKKRCVFADSWFASVDTALALKKELGVDFTGPIKTGHKYFPLEPIRWLLNEMRRGDVVVFKNEDKDLWAVGWHDNVFKSYLTTHGTTLPGKPADKRRQDKDTNVNFVLQVPRPACIAKYNEQMGAVDRHNFYRQGILRLHMAWKTKSWQTRIQLEILALTLVDSFLACTKLLPQWVHDSKEEESVFWKFVCSLIEQLDTRPRHERTREEEVDPTLHCHQVRLGTKRISSGNHKGERRPIQGRCTACIARKQKMKQKGRAPRTAWGCSCHVGKYFCRNKTCWSEHLREVRSNDDREYEI